MELGPARLESCVADAQQERIVVTRNGRPVALVIGLDEEQQQLGSSQRFWVLIAERRRQSTVSRAELEQRLQKMGAPGRRSRVLAETASTSLLGVARALMAAVVARIQAGFATASVPE